MKYIAFFETDIGRIGIAENGKSITNLFFRQEKSPADAAERSTPLLRTAAKEIKEYLKGKRTAFDLPLETEGTEFQMAVWEQLQTVPYGETRSYRDIAEMVGNAGACRAVGMANNRNPIAIIIPCHRIIGSNGSLVGYGGGLPLKQYLLNLERNVV